MLSKLIPWVKNLSQFNKNIVILSSGTLISQGLLVLISPVLTRLYTPEAFGILAIFTSIVTIFATVFTGKYEQSLFLPKRDHHAINLMGFTLFLTFFFSLILLGILAFTYTDIASLFSLPEYSSCILLFVPLMTFAIGVYSTFRQWFQRKEAYSVSSVNGVIQSVILISANIILALLGIKLLGLVWSYLLSIVLSALIFIYVFRRKYPVREFLKYFSWIRSLKMAIEYKRFPQYIIWAELLVILSQQMMPLLLTSLFTPIIAGYYSFANRILRIPSIVLANSIWGIYRNEAVKLINVGKSIKPVYLSIVKKLIILGSLPYLVIGIFGSPLFQFIFGSSWRMTGVYAQIMALFLFTELIAFPLSGTFVICDKQKTFLFIQILTLSLCTLGIILGKIIGDDITSIILFSVGGILSNLLSILLSYKIASK